MSSNRKDEIIMATLELAAQHGLGSVSMNMIAEKIGIKKPSLYKHFASREEIVEAMYKYLREKARVNSNTSMVDYGVLFSGRTALEVLQMIVNNYREMNNDKHMHMFYKVIYSERCIQPMAAKIMEEETQKMILATKSLFYAMQIHGLLRFKNPDMSALTFAMTIHGMLDYESDCALNKDESKANISNKNLIQDYLQWFCEENKSN